MSESQIIGKPLSELLEGYAAVDTLPDINIAGIASNSRQVGPGSLFIALRGINSQGLDYAIDAVKSGAIAVMYDADDDYGKQRIPLLSKQVTTHWIGIRGLERVNGEIVSRFYGDPGRYLKIIGVTGTDGKTSVTHLIVQALTQLGKSVASIGTLGYGIGKQLDSASHTTPDAVTLQSYLHEFRQQKCDYVIMEVSSHALQQYRVSGCDFDIAVLTNLGRDHLDYHEDMDHYAAAKARLFRDFELSARVLNTDDAFGCQLSQEFGSNGMIRYSASPAADTPDAEVYLIQAEVTEQGLDLRVATPIGEINASTALMGSFNIDNTVACISSLVAAGLDRAQIQWAVTGLQPIPGRMEKFAGASGRPAAVVDFAHTEQALRACLTASREHTRGQLWCVFGCGGDRDKGKRPGMGRAAEELADRIVITDDNPRSEDPEAIVEDIRKGLLKPQDASVVHNRQAAIEYALGEAGSGDLVVIAGKGHESEQVIGRERIPFSDRHLVGRFMQAES